MVQLNLAPADLQAVLILGLSPGLRIIPTPTLVGNYARRKEFIIVVMIFNACTDDDALAEAVQSA